MKILNLTIAAFLLCRTVSFGLTYSYSDVLPSSTASVQQGTTEAQMIKVVIVMTSGGGPKDAESFTLSTNGSSAPATDISNAKIFATGNTNTFSNTNQFGTTVAAPNGTFAVSGLEPLLLGNNYFWVTYDVPAGAVKCNVIDAECTSLQVSGVSYAPINTAPAGNRLVDGTMVYQSSKAFQSNFSAVSINTADNEILGIEIDVPGSVSAMTVTSFTFSTSGTSSLSDIANAKLWYTGGTKIFSTGTSFGSVIASPGASFNITGSQVLAGCKNYFWLTYDVLNAATTGNVIDAQCTSLIVGGISRTPTVTAPAGNRPIAVLTPFQSAFGNSAGDFGRAVEQTSDKGFIVAGYTGSFGAGNNDAYLVKTDSIGNYQWSKTIGESNYDYAYSVKQTSDGGFILTGYSNSFGAGLTDVYLVKTDATGTPQWSKAYGGAQNDKGYCIQKTSDGGFIIAGETSSYGAGAPTYSSIYLLKLDFSGTVQWSKTFGGATGYTIGRYVQQTTDGGYIITGETQSYGAGNYDIYLIKTNSTGTSLWTKTYGGGGSDQGYAVVQTTDGGFVLTGVTQSFGYGSSDMFLIRTDAAGNILWSNTYGGNSWDNGYSLCPSGEGGYIVGGGGYYGFGLNDAYFMKTDSQGNILVFRAFGGSGDENAYDAKQINDGEFIIAGASQTFGVSNSNDFYLVKSDGSGNSGCNQQNAVPFVSSFSPTVSSGTSSSSGATANTATSVASPQSPVTNVLCQVVVLPIELLSFTGTAGNEGNFLQWRTSAEINSNYFEIEKSTDGRSFKTAGKVKAGGNSTTPHNYSFTDFSPSGGEAYYRLKQIDLSGNFSYSNTISITQSPSHQISIYPNPANAEIHCTIYANTPRPGTICITDLLGNTLISREFVMTQGENNITVFIQPLPAGVYIMKTSEGRSLFVKQ